MIVAKFKCTSVTTYEHSEQVELNAVTDPSNENWAKFTPSGTLKMQIDNPAARGKLQPGKSYLLHIEPCGE